MRRLTKLLIIAALSATLWAQHPKRTVVPNFQPVPATYKYYSPTRPLMLKDPAGACWSIVLVDGGFIQVTKTTNSCTTQLTVASYPDQVAFQMGIDSLGHLQFTGVPFTTNYPTELFFLSSPSLTRDALYFRNSILFIAPTQGQ